MEAALLDSDGKLSIQNSGSEPARQFVADVVKEVRNMSAAHDVRSMVATIKCNMAHNEFADIIGG